MRKQVQNTSMPQNACTGKIAYKINEKDMDYEKNKVHLRQVPNHSL